MSFIHTLAIPAALVATLATAAAQDTPRSTPTPDKPAPAATQSTPTTTPASTTNLALASKLIHTDIVDSNNQHVADVADLVVQSSTGEIVIIADREKGEGLVAIPLDMLQPRFDKGDVKDAAKDSAKGEKPENPQVEALTLRGDASLVASAPTLKKDDLKTLDESAFENMRRHWSGSTNPAGKDLPPAAKDKARGNADDNREGHPAANTHEGEQTPPAAGSGSKAVGSNGIVCTEHAKGKNVKSPTGESLGEIKDFVVDLAAGKIAYAVVSTGGVMGVGEKNHGITLAALARGSDDTFTLNTDRKTLENSPGIDLDRLPSRPSLQVSAKASLTDDGSYAHRTPR